MGAPTKRWQVAAGDRRLEEKLAATLQIRPLAARLLVNRGITTIEGARTFLDPSLQRLHDPFQMRGMSEAVERLTRSLHAQEPIVIYGDYDVDGITATSVLSWFFRDIGVPVPYYLPHRMREGYGLNPDAVRKLAQRGARVLITVDCGITGHEEVRLARSLGMDVIVTDHHQVPPELPEAVAVLNPHQPGCSYPSKELSGVGIAFKLAMALRSRLRQEAVWREKVPNLRRHLDLVALGTVADVAPLADENRILVRHGLRELTRSEKLGLQALKRVAGIEGREMGPGQVGFMLAPRLNAAGRLAAAKAGVELLLSDRVAGAEKLARYLDSINRERQAVQAQIYQEAKAAIEAEGEAEGRWAIVLASEGWHPGVVGIVASKIVEEYGRPTILIGLAGDTGKGSGRSIAAFHLYRALQACQQHLVGFGGHEHAAGLSIRREQVPAFRETLNRIAGEQLTATACTPLLEIDAEVRLDAIDEPLLDFMARLEPCGAGNPQAVLLARGVEIQGEPTAVGQTQQHLRLTLRQGNTLLRGIGFGMGGLLAQVRGGRFDIAFTPERHLWNEREERQALLRDLKPHHS
ncbi:MAG: single-stranded-DNA-specific exonuclease RecJ [Nitrospinae bacterium]|nr:single-stranded-DNA-specific exonuclease RecJ [Nitrospinota bacterium]